MLSWALNGSALFNGVSLWRWLVELMAENMPDQTGRATGNIRPAETEEYSRGGGDLLNVGTSLYAKWANYLRKYEETTSYKPLLPKAASLAANKQKAAYIWWRQVGYMPTILSDSSHYYGLKQRKHFQFSSRSLFVFVCVVMRWICYFVLLGGWYQCQKMTSNVLCSTCSNLFLFQSVKHFAIRSSET